MSLKDISNKTSSYLQGVLKVESRKEAIRRRENKKHFSKPKRAPSIPYQPWLLSKVKREAKKKLFSVVSCFSGAGGSSTGYKMSGGDVRLISDFQEICIKNYLHNYPKTINICEDIRNLTGKQILKETGLKKKELDILDGSPPCPPFSMSGSKEKGWNKTKKVYGKLQTNIEDLTFDFISLAETIQPKVIICENVKGLTMKPIQKHFEKMISSFQDIGYQTIYKVMNSVDYGVAQKRERVFIVSIRNDVLKKLGHQINAMVFPDYSTRIWPIPLKDIYSQKDAIFSLMKDEENIEEGRELEKIMKTHSKYELLKQLPKSPTAYQSVGDINPKGTLFQTRRVPWDEPSNCLLEKGLETSFFSHIHPDKDRGFTTYEAMKIMGLPDGYNLIGDLNERLGIVGLMVSPPQMHYLSKHIYENVLRPLR
jgi:DNA (cytosine-5)-methyltransferase 1